MTKVGFIMLVHRDLHRAIQVARHWAQAGCPVVIHADSAVPQQEYDCLVAGLPDLENIRFVGRHRCEWGTFAIVRASLEASEVMLRDFSEVTHVYLTSGSCLPLRPVQELQDYLGDHPGTEFIESTCTDDVDWTTGGLDRERFTLRFPFSWRTQRRLFDGYVRLQRRLRFERRIPEGIDPHMGSQWWCLTRETLSAILNDPQRKETDTYFSRVWIPDESYFQTMTRKHAKKIESRSLTLAKFDFQGKPHVFYDDHLQLLKKSDCFIARKIWPEAEVLYQHFLAKNVVSLRRSEPNPRKIDRVFSRAVERRTKGRPGLLMHSRFPNRDWGREVTCAPFSVFEGFNHVFEDFETWLGKRSATRVHGHLFSRSGVQFSGNESTYNGCLSNAPKLRDYNPRAFLSNLLWATQGEHQCFQFGPGDNQDISWPLAIDDNANINVITGAWMIPLWQSSHDILRVRKTAARYQRAELAHLEILRSNFARANIRIWTLSDFIEHPVHHLKTILDVLDPGAGRKLTDVPRLVDLTGFGQFIQKLRNQGMSPVLVGDFPVEDPHQPETPIRTRPAAVR